MKVTNILIVIILLVQGDSYNDFVNIFPKIEYDEYGNFLTRELSAKTYSNLAKEYDIIPNNLSFKYLCDSDSSKFKYEYGLYNMDEDRYTKFVTEFYKHYAVSSWKKQNYVAVIYSKFDNRKDKFLLRTFNNQGDLVNELTINEYKYEGSGITPEFFSFSLISPDSIKLFTYNDTENPESEDEKSPLVTKVVIENYAIDSLGRFNRVDVDSVLLSKPMRAYSNFDVEPEVDDPVYKFWTLW
jgi:hypothetical protein